MMVKYDDVVKIVDINYNERKNLMAAGISIFSIDELVKDILKDLERLSQRDITNEEEMLKVIKVQNEYIERLETTIKTLMEVCTQ